MMRMPVGFAQGARILSPQPGGRMRQLPTLPTMPSQQQRQQQQQHAAHDADAQGQLCSHSHNLRQLPCAASPSHAHAVKQQLPPKSPPPAQPQQRLPGRPVSLTMFERWLESGQLGAALSRVKALYAHAPTDPVQLLSTVEAALGLAQGALRPFASRVLAAVS